jgi:hypothetical protein
MMVRVMRKCGRKRKFDAFGSKKKWHRYWGIPFRGDSSDVPHLYVSMSDGLLLLGVFIMWSLTVELRYCTLLTAPRIAGCVFAV